MEKGIQHAVAIAALVVAIVGVSIALVGSILGVLNYRRDRPKLLVTARAHIDSHGASAGLTAINTGYRPTTIVGAGFTRGIRRVGFRPFRHDVPDDGFAQTYAPGWPGHNLPTVVPAGDAFHFRALPITADPNEPSPLKEGVHVYVVEAGGRCTITRAVASPLALTWEEFEATIGEDEKRT